MTEDVQPESWPGRKKVNGSYFPGHGTLVEEYFLKGKAAGYAEAQAEGFAEVVLTVLRHRQIAVSEELRERIRGCHDLDGLERWMERAFTVTTADELIAEPLP